MYGSCARGRRFFYISNGEQCVGDRDDLKQKGSNLGKLPGSSDLMNRFPEAIIPLSEILSKETVKVVGSTESFSADSGVEKLDN